MLTVQNKQYHILAYLNNLEHAKLKEKLNGEYVLSFIALIDPLKTDCLYDDENYVVYNDDLFKAVNFTELHNEDNKVSIEVECEHVSYDLINNSMNEFNYIYKSAAEVMIANLIGTDFTLRHCDITEKTDIQYTDKCNSKQISIAIANNWHGELKYHRHYIDLLQSRGINRGTGFIFGKNLKSVKRIINRVDKTTSYEVEVVQGSELEELGYYELGDTVRVMDERLGVDIEVKIIELEKNILTGINSRVILGDAIKDMRSSFSSVKQSIEAVKKVVEEGSTDWNKINNITTALGDIVIGKKNEITNVVNKIINSSGTYQQLDNYSYWQDQPTKENSTFASMWGPEGMMYATQKDEYGEWIWSTVFDGDGVIANRVTVDALYGMLIEAVNITGSTITGGEIIGSTIKGQSVFAGNINMTGTITWNADSSPTRALYSIDGISNWHENYTEDQDYYAKYTYDGGQTWTPVIKIVGEDGQQGVPGPQGPQGSAGVNGQTLYTWVKYADTSTGTGMSDLPDGKKYIGLAYNKTTATESTVATDYSWSLIQGPQGSQGIQGPAGTNGQTLYTWLKYADTPTSGMSDSPTGKKYMGLAYNKTTATESTTYSDYSWSLIQGAQGIQGPQGVAGPKGETGATGSQGIQGPAGADGQPTYTWVKYALDQSGNGMWDIIGQYRVNEMANAVSSYTGITVANMENRKYMGLAHNKTTAVESTNKADYQWSLIAGENGVTYYTWYAYADDIRGSGFSFNPIGKSYMGVRYNAVSPLKTEDPLDYEWFKIKGENGSDANVPEYIKETYIDRALIQSPKIEGNIVNAGIITGGYIQGTTVSGSKFISNTIDNVISMLLEAGVIKFSRNDGKTGYYGSSDFTLFGSNNSDVSCSSYASTSLGTGATIASTGQNLILGVNNSSSAIRVLSNGGVVLDTGYSGNITLNTYDSGTDHIYLEGRVEAAHLSVSGDKQAIVPTQHYGVRSLYCEEADRAYFSTKGVMETIDGVCDIDLDPIFLEVIELNSSHPYIILLTPYSDARVWIESVEDHKFVVRSDKDTKFAYDLKAIRITYGNVYLEETVLSNRKLKAVQEAAIERMK